MITRVLVTVTTYPTLSNRHFETVCTAGFREDGSWIRIYPVPHRLLNFNKKYHKWQWIEVDLEKNPADRRPESYKISDIASLRLLDKIDGDKADWNLRKAWVNKGKTVFDDMTEVLRLKNESDFSLAVLHPVEILGFEVEKISDFEDYYRRLDNLKKKYEYDKAQMSLFGDEMAANESFEFAKKIPYRFKYHFKTKDGNERHLMIEDWEIGMLYLNCLKKDASPEKAVSDVRKKYEGFISQRDVHLFIGSQYRHHMKNAPNPFVIIGVFAPPKQLHMEPNLFDCLDN
ncbi:MAG: hypothetical protein NC248_12260 [Bacteroides sp.]|nr:hypothetical protein [Bacteroides sp.]MCM1391101.1 hypothetical protein [Bacteroides sp.]